jgi:hypothetical protein
MPLASPYGKGAISEPAAGLWAMNRYQFHLCITPEQYLDYYRGTIKQVVVRCATGQTVQFPASLLQRFVTPDGIQGSFVLTCNDQHHGAELRKLNSTIEG